MLGNMKGIVLNEDFQIHLRLLFVVIGKSHRIENN